MKAAIYARFASNNSRDESIEVVNLGVYRFSEKNAIKAVSGAKARTGFVW